jgi:hypothetical protein
MARGAAMFDTSRNSAAQEMPHFKTQCFTCTPIFRELTVVEISSTRSAQKGGSQYCLARQPVTAIAA